MFHWAEHRVIRGCAVALGAAALLLGLLALAGYLYDLNWQRKVEAKLAEFRAAGEPVTWEDVLERRQIPDGENLALVLLNGFGQLTEGVMAPVQGVIERLAYVEALGARPSERLRSLLRAYLAANSQALVSVHEAAGLEHGCYPLKAEANPLLTELPFLAPLRRMGRLCALDAYLRASDGDTQGAVRCLGEARALSASLGEEPIAVEAVVRIRLQSDWLDSVQRALSLCEVPAEDVGVLRKEMEGEDAALSHVSGLYGERAMGESVFRSPSAISVLGVDAPWRSELGWRVYAGIPGWRERDALFFYDYLDRAIAAARLPPRQELAAANDWTVDYEGSLGRPSHAYPISETLMPTALSAVTEEVEARARLSVARTALGVEEWRLKHGSWPDSLEQLVPDFLDAVPDDPFSESPIRYARTATGVVVYSVGKDSKDDGGISEEEARKRAVDDAFPEPTWDLPFRVLNPELRGATTLSFRDEIAATRLDLDALEKAGLTKERLLERGLTEDDLKRLAEQ